MGVIKEDVGIILWTPSTHTQMCIHTQAHTHIIIITVVVVVAVNV